MSVDTYRDGIAIAYAKKRKAERLKKMWVGGEVGSEEVPDEGEPSQTTLPVALPNPNEDRTPSHQKESFHAALRKRRGR